MVSKKILERKTELGQNINLARFTMRSLHCLPKCVFLDSERIEDRIDFVMIFFLPTKECQLIPHYVLGT